MKICKTIHFWKGYCLRNQKINVSICPDVCGGHIGIYKMATVKSMFCNILASKYDGTLILMAKPTFSGSRNAMVQVIISFFCIIQLKYIIHHMGKKQHSPGSQSDTNSELFLLRRCILTVNFGCLYSHLKHHDMCNHSLYASSQSSSSSLLCITALESSSSWHWLLH